ncbi:hypothetical protein K0U07_05815 [bacterium]|nr:hypothetical protein [bacterium]
MKKVSLTPYFALACFYYFALSFFRHIFPFLYFAPFFTTCFARTSLFFSLWTSFGIGLFLDLSTTSTPMGFYPICCVATTLLIHRLKIYFLEDKPIPFALYTAIYSFTFSLIFSLLHSFFDTKLSLSLFPFLLDSLFLPVQDSLYHLLFFTAPIYLYIYLGTRQQKVRYLRLKKRFFSLWKELQKKVFS